MRRRWLSLGLAWGLALSGGPASVGGQPPALEALLRDLQSDDFATREAATRRLSQASADAVGPLTELALTGDLETTERALALLRILTIGPDVAGRRAAQKALHRLSGSSRAAVRRRAALILQQGEARTIGWLRKRGVEFSGEGVSAKSSGLTDDDVVLLHDLPRMRTLDLGQTTLGDAGLDNLRGHPGVMQINLFRTRITDAGLPALLDLPALREIPMGYTAVTDKGLETLGQLTQLEYLGLRGTRVTDAGVAHLAGLTNLKGLYLGETAVTDASLRRFGKLSKLERLYLHDTQITDAGLQELAPLKALQKVDAWNTDVTTDGVQALQKLRPELQVLLKSGGGP